METILVSRAEKQELHLGAGEARRIVFLAASSADVDIQAELAGRARLELFFIFVASGKESVAARLHVRHAGADSESRVVVRGALRHRSRAAIENRIVVEKEARNASAEFKGKAFLCDAAAADIIPELEIQTPDAKKVRHAAAVRRITSEERQYLESRGLDPSAAADAVMRGFLRSPFTCAVDIPPELDEIEKKLWYGCGTTPFYP